MKDFKCSECFFGYNLATNFFIENHSCFIELVFIFSFTFKFFINFINFNVKADHLLVAKALCFAKYLNLYHFINIIVEVHEDLHFFCKFLNFGFRI